MNRIYEAMLLLDNREVRKGWQALKDDVNAVFTKHGAAIKSSRRWDERRLAYPIGRQLRGTYLLNYIDCDPQSLTAIRRDLEYSNSVLRYLMLVCETIPEDAFTPEESFDESAIRVETEDSPPAESSDEGPAKEETGRERRAKADAAKADAAKADAAKADAAPAESADATVAAAESDTAASESTETVTADTETKTPTDAEGRDNG